MPTADLRVTLVQTFLHWEQKAANLANLGVRLALLAGKTDLVILPEMFTTGFSMNARQLAENMQGPTVAWMQQMAEDLNAVVTGSFIAEEDGNYYNRLVWMQPDGRYATYDKRHLFTLAGEHNHYRAGQSAPDFAWQGWKIRPLICYDLRFPVWSRNTSDYDLLIYVANFPEKRRHAWQSLLVARAIENQAYTIGVNRVGKDGKDIYYTGDSQVVDYDGQVIFHRADEEIIQTMEISYEAQQAYRRKFAFLADRDHFSIDNING